MNELKYLAIEELTRCFFASGYSQQTLGKEMFGEFIQNIVNFKQGNKATYVFKTQARLKFLIIKNIRLFYLLDRFMIFFDGDVLMDPISYDKSK